MQAFGGLAPIGNRMRIDARIDERTMRELYLPAFEAAVKRADVGSVMCAYNKVNGPYACENKPLLEDILRGDWGFKGLTIADYNAAHDAGASLVNGLDFEPWPGVVYGPPSVGAALATGAATMDDVDRHVRRYLRTLFAYGALDRDAFPADEAAIDRAAHAHEARRIAEAGITLLRNDGTLPLAPRKLDSIAVIGAGADRFITGAARLRSSRTRSPRRSRRSPMRPGRASPSRGDDGSDAARAAELARGRTSPSSSRPRTRPRESTAVPHAECPPAFGDQDGLIEAVAAANPRTVVVIQSGGPVLTPWRKRVGAVLEAWYPGSEGGSAIARVLFGAVDAQGRLPVTFPRSEADLPTAGDDDAYPGVGDIVTYDEGLLVGYRHYDAHRIRPAYAFGHGLSYTHFRFSDLRVNSAGGGTAKRHGALAKVSVAVTNTAIAGAWRCRSSTSGCRHARRSQSRRRR